MIGGGSGKEEGAAGGPSHDLGHREHLERVQLKNESKVLSAEEQSIYEPQTLVDRQSPTVFIAEWWMKEEFVGLDTTSEVANMPSFGGRLPSLPTSLKFDGSVTGFPARQEWFFGAPQTVTVCCTRTLQWMAYQLPRWKLICLTRWSEDLASAR